MHGILSTMTVPQGEIFVSYPAKQLYTYREAWQHDESLQSWHEKPTTDIEGYIALQLQNESKFCMQIPTKETLKRVLRISQ